MAALDAAKIRYLIVGGIAVGYYAVPRLTKDIDVLVAVDPTNAQTLFDSLKEFGAPIHLVSPRDFESPDFVFYFGVPPWRVDILTSIPGVEFDEAYERRTVDSLGDYQANFISKDDLISAKRASGRVQDLQDLEALLKSRKS